MLRFFNKTVLALIILLLFAGGVWQLVDMRFSTGEHQPAYSTFRADPKGCRAFMESLDSLADRTAAQGLRDLHHLTKDTDQAIMILGTHPKYGLSVSEKELSWIRTHLKEGGRIVLTYASGNWADIAPPGTHLARPDDEDLPPGMEASLSQSLEEEWNIQFEQVSLSTSEAKDGDIGFTTRRGEHKSLPSRLSWRSTTCFDTKDSTWKTIYSRGDLAVVMEKKIGEGTLIVASDTFLFSNEALLNERETAFLMWTAGDKSHFVFDETHLGIREQPGVTALARRYGFDGAMISLLILAGLFIWRHSTPLAPRYEEAEEVQREGIQGNDAASALGHLLRRNIPRKKLLTAFVDEWKASTPLNKPNRNVIEAQLQSLADTDMTGLSEADILDLLKKATDLTKNRNA